MNANDHLARVALRVLAAAATVTTIALVPLSASPAHAQPVTVPTPAAPTATAAAVPAKLPLPTASTSLPVSASLPVPTASVPVTTKLPTTAVPLPSVQASLPPVSVSAGPVQATLQPVTASRPSGAGSPPSAATRTTVGSSGSAVVAAPPTQRGDRVTPPPLGYDSGPGAAHHLDSLPAAVLNANAPSAGLTPKTHIPGGGSSGVAGRRSVAAPSLTQSPPAVSRGQLMLAVLAILVLSVVTAECARGVLLRRRPVR
jgi:hypothetical protein